MRRNKGKWFYIKNWLPINFTEKYSAIVLYWREPKLHQFKVACRDIKVFRVPQI